MDNFIFIATLCTFINVEILCGRGMKFVTRGRGFLPEDFMAIGRSFDKSRKLMIL